MLIQWESLLIFIPLVSGCISLMLAGVAFLRRTVAGALPFMFMLLSAALWSLGQFLELLSRTLEAKIFWDNLQFIAQSGVVLSGLIFTLHYTSRRGLLKRWMWALLAIEPVLIAALAWTDPAHHLIRLSPRLVQTSAGSVLVYELGVGMWVDAVYLMAVALFMLILLFTYFLRASRSYRWQIGVVLIGASLPFFGGVLSIMELFPPFHRDLFPEIFGISSLILAWGIFRQGLLELAPIARAAVFDQMVGAVFVLDMQNRIVDLNPAAYRLIGLAADKSVGQMITDQFPDWPNMAGGCPDLAAGSLQISLETEQGRRCFDLSHSPLSNRRGVRTGCLIVLRDITERRQAEEAYRVLVDHSLQGLTILQDNRMVFANPTIADILGYSVEEITAFSAEEMFQVIHPEERGEALENTQRRLANQPAPDRFEFRVFRKDGSIRWMETYSTLIDYHGKPAIQSAYLDITERRQSEEERERLISELDAFAHTVAHNIKGPLGIVLGFADMLADEDYPSTEEQIKEAAVNIRSYTAKLTNIVDELLLLASLRTDQEIPSTDLDMIVPIYGVRQRLADLIRKYEARIDLPESWPLAYGYGPWVEEVWVNYVSNGIKYGGRPPHLELGATVLPDGMIKFWVRDNGLGIAPEDRCKLFIPHSRLDGVSAKGDGLGLSIVERIVTRLGGEVGVESEKGKGSTFSFTLPPASAI